MNLQARRIKGDQFTAEDKLEVVLNTNNTDLASAFHTVEVVSGVAVTHGGGAPAGDFLHYKAYERDANADGVIDYSTIEMQLEQASQGASVVKVVCEAVTKADSDTYRLALQAWKDAKEEQGDSFTDPQPEVNKTVLETGEITLNWSDDTLV